MKNNKKIKIMLSSLRFTIFVFFVFFVLIFVFKSAYGRYVYDGGGGYEFCISSRYCGKEPTFYECVNGPSVGNNGGCPIPACTGGKLWSKYVFSNECVQVEGSCYWKFNRKETWASIGDKLQPFCPNCGSPRDGYLAAGLCQPNQSGGFY